MAQLCGHMDTPNSPMESSGNQSTKIRYRINWRPSRLQGSCGLITELLVEEVSSAESVVESNQREDHSGS